MKVNNISNLESLFRIRNRILRRSLATNHKSRKMTIEMSTWLGLLSGVPLLYQTGLFHALVDPEVGEYSDERDEIDNPTAHERARGNKLFQVIQAQSQRS